MKPFWPIIFLALGLCGFIFSVNAHSAFTETYFQAIASFAWISGSLVSIVGGFMIRPRNKPVSFWTISIGSLLLLLGFLTPSL